MFKKAMMGGCIGLVLTFAIPASAGDCSGCKLVKQNGEGFCCGKGLIYGVKLASEKLFETLSGSKVTPSMMKCPGCKAATANNGTCDHCRVAVAHGKVYHSSFSHDVARGTPVTAKKAAHCPGCAKALANDAQCTACNVGFVAGRMFKDKSHFDAAKSAVQIIGTAAKAATHCQACAIAMVTNGECSQCKVKFQNGKKVG